MKRHTWSKIFVIILSLTAGLSSQTHQGNILGTISDKSGAVISNAKVTVTNIGTSQTRTLQTNDSGEYNAPNLEPGRYSIVVEASGFRKMERPSISLEVARTLKLDFQLEPGASAETI